MTATIEAMARAIGRTADHHGYPLYKSLSESELRSAAQAALRAISAAGMAVVPVEATDEMVEEGTEAYWPAVKEANARRKSVYGKEAHASCEVLPQAYRAMIRAGRVDGGVDAPDGR